MGRDRDAVFDLQTLKVLLLTPALRTLHMCNRYVADGWSARRIAEEMGTTEDAVRKAVQRALKKLDGTKLSGFDVSVLKRR